MQRHRVALPERTRMKNTAKSLQRISPIVERVTEGMASARITVSGVEPPGG